MRYSVKQDFDYFLERYASANDASDRLKKLLGQRGEGLRQEITSGLQSNASDPAKMLALTFICYRLRNNLFHGEKAIYGFEGQHANFTHATGFMGQVLKSYADELPG